MKYIPLFSICLVVLVACSPKLGEFIIEEQPQSPDYSLEKNWSSLPFRKDAADYYPKEVGWISDSLKEVDVFYVHPTMYQKGETWNADLSDKKLNKKVDNKPVKLQASAFNAVGQVYAPRYRQAIIDSYYDESGKGHKALNFAYQDVKKAFQYYLENYNNNRPIIIASHSQGSTHTIQLLKDFFDNPQMKKQLVVAYLIGMGIDKTNYSFLSPCLNEKETNCYITWASYQEGFEPDSNSILLGGNVQTNPISWKTSTEKVEGGEGFLLNVNRKKSFQSSAQIKEDYLWVTTNATLFKKRAVLHVVDYNLFWYNIRENVELRVLNFIKNK